MRVLVLGYIVRGPLAGYAWHHVQYVIGLKRLGFDVWYFEDSEDWPSCYDPRRNLTDSDPTYGLHFADMLFKRVGLGERWGYFDAHQNQWHGPAGGKAHALANSADIIINLSGINPLRGAWSEVPLRVYVDTDPVFTQVRHLTDPWFKARTDQHNRFFSFGVNLKQPGCTVPDDGYPWVPTRQPVCTDLWPVTPPVSPNVNRPFTTVMQWDSYAKREHQGVTFGMKSMSFEPYMNLPSEAAPISLELAMTGDEAAARLSKLGWRINNPLLVTSDPWRYQAYIQQSMGEWSIAKHGYVSTHSGWFSERSCCYLASGRPVVVQDTGFSNWLPCGEGLIAFANLEQAVTGLHDVVQRYPHHCAAARALVETHFDAEKVLTKMVNDVKVGS